MLHETTCESQKINSAFPAGEVSLSQVVSSLFVFGRDGGNWFILMARIRSIKPEFWTDEKVVTLSPFARLLFIGLWNFVDDDGRCVFSPVRLKLQILPMDKIDVSKLFAELLRISLISSYSVEGIEYIQVIHFSDHQKIDKRSPSRLPSPPNPPESPRIPTTDQGRDQGRDQGVEGKGSRSGGEEGTPPAQRVSPSSSEKDFWKGLHENPAYSPIDLVAERGKMEAWLDLPKNRNRKMTRAFVLRWLNKIEKPLEHESSPDMSRYKKVLIADNPLIPEWEDQK